MKRIEGMGVDSDDDAPLVKGSSDPSLDDDDPLVKSACLSAAPPASERSAQPNIIRFGSAFVKELAEAETSKRDPRHHVCSLGGLWAETITKLMRGEDVKVPRSKGRDIRAFRRMNEEERSAFHFSKRAQTSAHKICGVF